MKTGHGTQTVASRLYRLVAVFAIVLVVGGVLSIRTLNRVKVNGPVYGQIAQQKDLLGDILPPPLYVLETYFTALQMLGETDPALLKEEANKVASLKKDFTDRTEYWNKQLTDAQVRPVILEESFKPATEFFDTLEKEFVPAIQRGDKAAATTIAFGKLRAEYLAHRKAIDQAVTMATQASEKLESGAATEVRHSLWMLGTVLVASLVLIGLYSAYITRSLVSVVSSTALQLSEGSDQVTSAAGQVSSASQSLAEGTSEQAASIEETSASMEETSAMTKTNAENARKAGDLAKQTREAAEKGAADMQEMMGAMQAIKGSSDDIARIIKTIDEIAFQTNILALNAAVEAARAGEAGMGFAVVAEEVRSLAQRSATAAKETSEKIEGAIGNTERGVELSGRVAEALGTIVGGIRQVDQIVADVASASNEQSQGISQLNEAVSQMDKVTQGNAANAEETASAAEELNAQAVTMKEALNELLSLAGTRQTGPASVGRVSARTERVSAPVSSKTKPVKSRMQQRELAAAGSGKSPKADAMSF